MPANLKLYFCLTPSVSLLHASFFNPVNSEMYSVIRGNCSFGRKFSNIGWTSAVKALCILTIRTKLAQADYNFLCGQRGSIASSLDASISKCPSWCLDLFGMDDDSKPYMKKLFKRVNPELKRPGPVIVSFNSHILKSTQITIFIDSHEVEELNKLKDLEERILTQCKSKGISDGIENSLLGILQTAI